MCALPVSEHEAVAGAIHGFHAPFLPFHVKGEHSVFVVLGMSCVCMCVNVYGGEGVCMRVCEGWR